MLVSLPLASVGVVVADGETVAIAFLSKVNVTLTYVHSAENFLVVEEYALEGCGLRLVGFGWAGFGAGMPSSTGDLEGCVLSQSPSGGLRAAVNLEMGGSVTIAVKHMLRPRLLVDGREVGAGESVAMRTCLKVSLLELAVRYIAVALLR